MEQNILSFIRIKLINFLQIHTSTSQIAFDVALTDLEATLKQR